MKIPEQLERIMFGFIESQVLFVCDELKIFDYLTEHGCSSLSKISEALQLPQTALERLLICAQCINLLEKQEACYKINPIWMPFLSKKSIHYCGFRFGHYYKTSYKMFHYLRSAVYENQPQWEKVMEKNLINDFDNVYADFIYADKTSTEEFLSTMWASGYDDSVELCQKFSFSNYKQLVDLGGATGSFAIAAMQQNSNLSVTIMDYAQVQPYAEQQFYQFDLSERAMFCVGDIFKDNLPKGDIYSIGYLLSDWPDPKSLLLIQKVYDNLPTNGLIVILEKLFNENKNGPYLTAMLNLTMLIEMNGNHKTACEYLSILKGVGFRELQVIYSTGEKQMIIGIK